MSFYDSKSIETGTFNCKILRMGRVDIYCFDRIVTSLQSKISERKANLKTINIYPI